MPGDELTLTVWLWLGLAAVLVGVAKTALNGVGSIAVVIFAAVLPARESTGAILPLLLCGDVLSSCGTSLAGPVQPRPHCRGIDTQP